MSQFDDLLLVVVMASQDNINIVLYDRLEVF